MSSLAEIGGIYSHSVGEIKRSLKDADTGSFMPTEQIFESSTARMFRGNFFLLNGTAYKCVLKIPSSDAPGTAYNFLYGDPDGVCLAFTSLLDEVSHQQPLSPELAVVGVENFKEQDGFIEFQLNFQNVVTDEGEVGLLMFEVPPELWFRSELTHLLRSDNWYSEITSVSVEAVQQLLKMQKIAPPDVAILNTAEQLRQWPLVNGFDRIVALHDGLDNLRKCWHIDLNEFIESEGLKYLGELQVRQVQTMREGFVNFVDQYQQVFDSRIEQQCIVIGHGDARADNILCIRDGEGNLKVVALDPTRFVDIATNTLRPWHMRDKMWDVAYFVSSTAAEVAAVKGVIEAASFIATTENRLRQLELISADDAIAFRLYSMYGLYVQSDTLLRVVYSQILGQKFEQAGCTLFFPDLLRGREGFDLPHTKAVVYWIKQIAMSEPQLNAKVLVAAAYAHDWGYIDMGIGKDASIDQVHDAKEQHMLVGSQRIAALLTQECRDEFSADEIEKVRHLVFVHDRLSEVKTDDEIALVEADTLGALDTDWVTPTFSKADNDRYINEQVLALRRPLFRHRLAIEVFETLLAKRRAFYS
jgi:hypothetical protein